MVTADESRERHPPQTSGGALRDLDGGEQKRAERGDFDRGRRVLPIGGMAQIANTLSLRHAQASLMAPFEYSTLICLVVIGYLAFGRSPAITTITGGVIVAAAGLMAVWREGRLKRRLPMTETALLTAEV